MAESTVKEDKPAKNPDEGGDGKKPRSSTSASQTEGASGLASAVRFVQETMVELGKISWPDRQQVIRETLSVIVLVFVITVSVLGFDWIVGKAVFEPLDHLARHMGGGIGAHR